MPILGTRTWHPSTWHLAPSTWHRATELYSSSMGFTPVETIWFNGTLVPWGEAKVHVLAHALHYGTGVFEGMRCYPTADGPAVFRLDAHLERFYASAALYDLDIPYSTEALVDATHDVLRQN